MGARDKKRPRTRNSLEYFVRYSSRGLILGKRVRVVQGVVCQFM